MDELSAVLSALADPTRRDILARLSAGDATVGELADRYPISPQAVSKHLGVLARAGLVSRRREAQRRPVHLEPDALDLVGRWLEQQHAPVAAAPPGPTARGSHRLDRPTPLGAVTWPTTTAPRPVEHGRHRADLDVPARDGADGAGLEHR